MEFEGINGGGTGPALAHELKKMKGCPPGTSRVESPLKERVSYAEATENPSYEDRTVRGAR